MISHLRWLLTVVALATLPFTYAGAATVPFVESFDDDAANWRDIDRNILTHHASGGFEDGSYVSANFSFTNFTAEDFEDSEPPSRIIIRGRTVDPPIGSPLVPSDGAFFGNWLSEGAGELRVRVRHDAPQPLSMYVRLASPANFPGIISVADELVQPGEWAELVVPVDLDVSQWIFEGMPSTTVLKDVLQNVGRIQVAAFVPENLAGLADVYTLQVDSIALYPVPEPSTWVLLIGMGGCLFLTRRQWRSAGF